MNKVVMGTALLFLSVVAAAEDKDHPRAWTSATDLMAQCSQVLDQFSTGACVGYVVAAAEIADSGRLKGYRSCIPKDVTKGQLQDVVTKYLAKHPEQLEYIGYQVAVVALVEAYPCQER
jgi:hypothetical protein